MFCTDYCANGFCGTGAMYQSGMDCSKCPTCNVQCAACKGPPEGKMCQHSCTPLNGVYLCGSGSTFELPGMIDCSGCPVALKEGVYACDTKCKFEYAGHLIQKGTGFISDAIVANAGYQWASKKLSGSGKSDGGDGDGGEFDPEGPQDAQGNVDDPGASDGWEDILDDVGDAVGDVGEVALVRSVNDDIYSRLARVVEALLGN